MAKPSNIRSATDLATVTNTDAETTLASVVIPAFNIKMDHVIDIALAVKTPSTDSSDTLTVKLKLGSVVLATVAAFDAANANVCWIRLKGFIDASTSLLHFIAEDGRTGAAADVEETTDVAFDCNAALTLSATATWSVAAAANQAVPKYFTVTLQPVD